MKVLHESNDKIIVSISDADFCKEVLEQPLVLTITKQGLEMKVKKTIFGWEDGRKKHVVARYKDRPRILDFKDWLVQNDAFRKIFGQKECKCD